MKSVFTPLPLSRSPTHYVKESGEEEKQKGRAARREGQTFGGGATAALFACFSPDVLLSWAAVFFLPSPLSFPTYKRKDDRGCV